MLSKSNFIGFLQDSTIPVVDKATRSIKLSTKWIGCGQLRNICLHKQFVSYIKRSKTKYNNFILLF